MKDEIISEADYKYMQDVADYLFQLEEAKYISIASLTDNPEKFIKACKLASITYNIDITFLADYSKVKRERTWFNCR